MTAQYKYADYINELAECPPLDSIEITSNIYRFIFEDKDDENNFKPVLLINPKRLNSSQFDTVEIKCSGYGLSTFTTLDNAKNFYLQKHKRNKNFHQNVGKYAAELAITPKEGKADRPGSNGHLNFFEYAGTDLKTTIINIEKLME